MSDKKKEVALAPASVPGDPFALLRQMTDELDRVFTEPFGPSFRLPSFRAFAIPETVTWSPRIDVFEKDHRLITRVDLPGAKKEDVTVEFTDGRLAISGERKRESEEQKENFYRREREYGSFYRAIPLPEGVKIEDVKATFADGVLEVSVPLPVLADTKVRKIEIEQLTQGAKSAA